MKNLGKRGFLVRWNHIQKNKKSNEEGQVAFEFLLIFAIALGMTFMFLYVSMNFVGGYLAHYATYMASRTFMVGDDGGANLSAVMAYAENQGRKVFDRYNLQIVKIDPSNLVFLRPEVGGKNVFVGATFRFQKLLSPLKIVGGAERATYYTESFLGKEPVRRTCYERMCSAIGETQCISKFDVTLFDNGC